MIVEVTVVPKSGKFSCKLKDGKLRVHLKSPPEENKANIELLKELKKLLACEVRLVSGQKSRHKKIEVAMDGQSWEKFLNSFK